MLETYVYTIKRKNRCLIATKCGIIDMKSKNNIRNLMDLDKYCYMDVYRVCQSFVTEVRVCPRSYDKLLLSTNKTQNTA